MKLIFHIIYMEFLFEKKIKKNKKQGRLKNRILVKKILDRWYMFYHEKIKKYEKKSLIVDNKKSIDL